MWSAILTVVVFSVIALSAFLFGACGAGEGGPAGNNTGNDVTHSVDIEKRVLDDGTTCYIASYAAHIGLSCLR